MNCSQNDKIWLWTDIVPERCFYSNNCQFFEKIPFAWLLLFSFEFASTKANHTQLELSTVWMLSHHAINFFVWKFMLWHWNLEGLWVCFSEKNLFLLVLRMLITLIFQSWPYRSNLAIHGSKFWCILKDVGGWFGFTQPFLLVFFRLYSKWWKWVFGIVRNSSYCWLDYFGGAWKKLRDNVWRKEDVYFYLVSSIDGLVPMHVQIELDDRNTVAHM